MKTKFFYLLFIIIIFIFLSMDCFTTGGKRTDFSYNPDKANADLISKTDLSSYIDDCAKAGIDYKDNKLYLAYGKDILQFDSNSLVSETAHNIFLDVTYDYNITSITHDNSYFYILANEYDQTGDVIKQYILKESTVGNTIETYYYFTTNNNRVVRIKYDLDNSMFLSLYLVSTYYYGNDDYILTKYFLYYLKFNNNIIDLSRVGIDYNLDRKCIQSFCYNNNNILPSFWENHDEIGIIGSIDIFDSYNYYTVWNAISTYTIDASYLGDDDYVCIYDMVFDGTYLWCLVNDDDIDAYITGGGTPYLLKLRPKW